MIVCVSHMMWRLCKQYSVINQVTHTHDGVYAGNGKGNGQAETVIRICADVHLLGDALAPTPPGDMGSA